jgi:hypothetical protein
MSLGIDHNTNFEDKNEICSKYNGSLLKMKENNVPLYYYCQMPNCNDITSDNLNSYTDINDSLVNFKKPMCDVDPNDYPAGCQYYQGTAKGDTKSLACGPSNLGTDASLNKRWLLGPPNKPVCLNTTFTTGVKPDICKPKKPPKSNPTAKSDSKKEKKFDWGLGTYDVDNFSNVQWIFYIAYYVPIIVVKFFAKYANKAGEFFLVWIFGYLILGFIFTLIWMIMIHDVSLIILSTGRITNVDEDSFMKSYWSQGLKNCIKER